MEILMLKGNIFDNSANYDLKATCLVDICDCSDCSENGCYECCDEGGCWDHSCSSHGY